MKNAWLGSVTGIVLGGAAVWGYLGYSGQSTATATVQQPKTDVVPLIRPLNSVL